MFSPVVTPDRKTELNNDLEWIQKAIAQLPEKQRIIIQRRDIEEMEFEEIAEVLEEDLNLIRVNLSRARKKIRETLLQLHTYGSENN